MASKMFTESIGGNLHAAASYVNERGWAKYVVGFEAVGGSCIIVFRMPARLVRKIRRGPSYVILPSYDDPKGWLKNLRLRLELPAYERKMKKAEEQEKEMAERWKGCGG